MVSERGVSADFADLFVADRAHFLLFHPFLDALEAEGVQARHCHVRVLEHLQAYAALQLVCQVQELAFLGRLAGCVRAFPELLALGVGILAEPVVAGAVKLAGCLLLFLLFAVKCFDCI